MTKSEQAKAIVAANPSASRSQLIEMFMSQLSMSKAGASTYYYNVTKGSPKTAKTKTVKAKSTKATKAAKPAKKEMNAEEKAKRLDLMRNVGKRFNRDMAKLKEQEQEMLAAIETDETAEDVKQYIPRFLHKELGLL